MRPRIEGEARTESEAQEKTVLNIGYWPEVQSPGHSGRRSGWSFGSESSGLKQQLQQQRDGEAAFGYKNNLMVHQLET